MEGRGTYPSEASFRTGCDGGQCAGDGRPGPGDRSGFADPLDMCARMHADVVVKSAREGKCWTGLIAGTGGNLA